MDKPTLYLETSVISYLAARPSRDPVTARNQQITREWWDTRRINYELRTSDIVLAEVREGDLVTASRRLSLLQDVPTLSAKGRKVAWLANELLRSVPLPGKAHADALHIAVAAVNGMEYLLTWNCKHIANPRLSARIERVIRAAGLRRPLLCTPAELIAGSRTGAQEENHEL
jgi:hypothetical protein